MDLNMATLGVLPPDKKIRWSIVRQSCPDRLSASLLNSSVSARVPTVTVEVAIAGSAVYSLTRATFDLPHITASLT